MQKIPSPAGIAVKVKPMVEGIIYLLSWSLIIRRDSATAEAPHEARFAQGTYALEPSVSGYAKHLRRLAQGRHGTEETLSTAEVEALWRGKLRAFRILAVPHRVLYLSARQTVVTQELRDCLTELADSEKDVA